MNKEQRLNNCSLCVVSLSLFVCESVFVLSRLMTNSDGRAYLNNDVTTALSIDKSELVIDYVKSSTLVSPLERKSRRANIV